MKAYKKIGLAFVALLVMGIAPTGAAFAQIKVTAATPSSTEQGTIALDVVVNGSGFDKTAMVDYFVTGTTNPGGITVRKVVFHSSKELVTTIDVADTADLASFDIQVRLQNGRKGKGTTLFSVKPKPNSPPNSEPPPTYPTGRYWHTFTSNGGETAATSRLYMYGGDGGPETNWQSVTDNLWAYSNAGSTGATWTFIPQGTSGPGSRKHHGWSCGGGWCVLAGGYHVATLEGDTWVFNESARTWSQVSCTSRRAVCPSARMGPAMAYNPANGTHILFGGSGSWPTVFNDTFTFAPDTMKWVKNSSGSAATPRRSAVATFVPVLGQIVMFGGQEESVRALSDMYAWDGKNWSPIQQLTDGTLTAVPTLHSHSMAWDPIRQRLIVTGGYVDVNDTPNPATFFVAFARTGGNWQATWTRASGIGCQAAAGSAPDAVVHPDAKMAFDVSSGTQVFFGGGENVDGVGAVAYGNTVECK